MFSNFETLKNLSNSLIQAKTKRSMAGSFPLYSTWGSRWLNSLGRPGCLFVCLLRSYDQSSNRGVNWQLNSQRVRGSCMKTIIDDLEYR